MFQLHTPPPPPPPPPDAGSFVQFSRTVAPLPSKGGVLIGLMRHYNWSNAVMLSGADEVFSLSRTELSKQMQAAGIYVLLPAVLSLSEQPLAFNCPGTCDIWKLALDLITAVLGQIKRSGIRIVTVLAFNDAMLQVGQAAVQQSMTGGYVWLAPDDFFLTFDLGACRRRTPRPRTDLKVPKNAPRQDLFDAACRFNPALGDRRRHAPKTCQKIGTRGSRRTIFWGRRRLCGFAAGSSSLPSMPPTGCASSQRTSIALPSRLSICPLST